MVHIDFEVVENKGFGNFSINVLEYCPLINDCGFVNGVSEKFCKRGEYETCMFYQDKLRTIKK